MHLLRRLLTAFVIVLSGLALMPYIALPSEQFRWQRFAGVYGEDPVLACNYPDGRAGSFFSCVATNFPAEEEATISISREGQPWIDLTILTTSEIGTVDFIIATPDDLLDGDYLLKVEDNPVAETSFSISESAPLREQEGDAPVIVIAVPAFVGDDIRFLPIIAN